ncbi:MAG TPA: hypothetical protein VM282_12425, partial [Acidimicrobiales bacterium]|nr:hypothetical protein [Acidimicrobiales bacterium]
MTASPHSQPSVETGQRHTVLYTDGDRLYNDIAGHIGIIHERLVLISSTQRAHDALPAVHRVASLLKRWLAGTLHDGQQ